MIDYNLDRREIGMIFFVVFGVGVIERREYFRKMLG